MIQIGRIKYTLREALELIDCKKLDSRTVNDIVIACEGLLECIEDVVESGKAGITVATSSSTTQTYEVTTKFRTIEDMHRFYNALAQLTKVHNES